MLTAADVEKAVGTGNTLTIKDPMNDNDLAAVKAYLDSHADAALQLDLSCMTGLNEIPDEAIEECTGLASMKLSDNITKDRYECVLWLHKSDNAQYASKPYINGGGCFL